MKILMLNYEFPPLGGGSSPVTLHLGRDLVRRGHEVDVVTMGYRGLPREETVEGINVIRVPCWRRREDRCSTPEMITYVLSVCPRLPALCARRGYDVNHTHFIFPTGLAALYLKRKTGLPFMITSHGSDVPGYNPDRFQWQHRLLLPLWRRIVKQAEVITTPSEDHAKLVRGHAPDARIEAIPNGIDPDEFDATKPRKKIILGAGRLFPRKNYAALIEALTGLDQEWEVVLLGEGTEAERLTALAAEKKVRLRITGWLDRRGPELRELFQTASIFVLPSLRESFGMVVAEAMAAGMAVVTSDSGGPAEVAGEAGLLVPPRDIAALRRAIFSLLENPQLLADLGARGRERAKSEFAWQRVTGRFESLYHELAQSGLSQNGH